MKLAGFDLTAEERKIASSWDCSPLEYWTCCDQKRVIDPDRRGTTAGGLAVIGAVVCTVCGNASIAKGVTREALASDAGTAWTVTAAGRSVNCGGVRIRAEGKAKGVEALMARIARLPELEAEVVRLRAEAARVLDVQAARAEHVEIEEAIPLLALARNGRDRALEFGIRHHEEMDQIDAYDDGDFKGQYGGGVDDQPPGEG